MLDKRDWAVGHADMLRRALMLEPRGHGGMCGAILTEPTTPGAHAGLLFMDSGGWRMMCGHAVAAVTAVVLRNRLLVPGGDGRTIVFDTPAGRLRARAEGERFESVSFSCVPSFVLHAGVAVQLAARLVHVDVAFGGEFYAIVDSEIVGLPIASSHLPEIARRAAEIVKGLEAITAVFHPLESRLGGIGGVIFTGPSSSPAADLRSVTVSGYGQAVRSPDAAGAAAVMAVLEAMGLLPDGGRFTLEGPVGTTVTGRLVGRTRVGEIPAVIPELEEMAWMTGEHLFLIEDDDPFREGFVF
jgi:proline racemase